MLPPLYFGQIYGERRLFIHVQTKSWLLTESGHLTNECYRAFPGLIESVGVKTALLIR